MNSTPPNDDKIPDGYKPTDIPGVYEYNPGGYVRTPEQEKLFQDALAQTRKLPALEQAELEKSHQYCPVCGNKVIENPRYPQYLCSDCVSRAVDAQGRPVKLFNQSMGGGFLAQYEDGSPAPEVESSHLVYIDRKTYHADEAYMSGIVVTPLSQ